MERRFLKNLFILFFIVGCQQLEIDQTNESTLQISPDITRDIFAKENIKKNVWQYMQLNNNLEDDFVIDEQVLSYMNIHLKDLEKFEKYLNDSYYFIYFVVDELEKNNLPVELAILPYIESNYDPFSISPSGAVGMWQFMPRTGRLYKLNKSWWNEDRHDPFKSTEAAVEYLKYLYQRFDQDIYLTIASYNAGPSLVDKRINQNKRRGEDIDFWSHSLPSQTKN